jgi:hypothetical protein
MAGAEVIETGRQVGDKRAKHVQDDGQYQSIVEAVNRFENQQAASRQDQDKSDSMHGQVGATVGKDGAWIGRCGHDGL